MAVAATLAMSVSYMDRQALAAIAPTVREELHISHQAFGWLTSAFAIAYLTFAPGAGWLVDKVGPRKALTGAVLVWSLVAALHATASSFAALVVLRIALGCAEAPSFPAAARTVRGALEPKERSAGFGLLFTGSSIGAMIAGPLAVSVTRTHGFRYAFVVTAVVGLIWLPLWLLATSGGAADRVVREDQESARPKGAAGPLLLHPAMQRQAVVVAASAPAIAFVLSWYPQLLVESTGISKDDVGHYLWLPPLLFDAAAILFGVFASARDRRKPGASHGGLMVLACLLLSTLALVPLFHGPWGAVIIGGVSMAGGAGMYVISTADLMRRVDPLLVATAGGVSAAVQSIAQITTGPLIGAYIDRTHAWAPVLIGLGLLGLPGGIGWALMPAERTSPIRAA